MEGQILSRVQKMQHHFCLPWHAGTQGFRFVSAVIKYASGDETRAANMCKNH